MFLHFYALGLLAIGVATGAWYRVTAPLFAIAFTYVFLLDQARYLNHFYLISLLALLLAVIPAHRAGSWDSWRHPEIQSETIPLWTVWLLRFQVGLPYFYGGVAKLNADWLRGEPLRSWLAERADLPLVGSWLTAEPVVWLFTYGAVLLDLLVVPLLLWPRTRLAAYGLTVLFHVLNWRLFDIGIFPPLMIAATTIFFDPDWPVRLLARVRKNGKILMWGTAPAFVAPRGTRARLVVGFCATYVTVQVLVPLRHFLYPGNVNWTEEGHRFAWHMKLREKDAEAEFVAIDPLSGQSWPIDPMRYLASWQYDEMVTRPDMVLQFCRHVAADLRCQGHSTVEIRAKVGAALNDRPVQWMIDPTVNLAALPRTLGHARWIVPLKSR